MSGLVRRPERRTFLLGTILLVLLACLLHREVLFDGFVYHDDDVADHQVPGRAALRRALVEGRLPSWEPGAFSGYPILASPDLGFFYPPNFLFFTGPREGEPVFGASAGIPPSLGLVVALHVVLGGLGMLLLLRRHVSGGAALFGAIAFALSSFGVLRIRHLPFLELVALLPYVLVGIELALAGRRAGWLVAGLATAFALLTGANAILPFVLPPMVAYAGVRLGEHVLHGPRDRLAKRAREAMLGVACLLAGASIAAVALLPAIAAIPETTRALGTTYEFASQYALPDVPSLSSLVFPTATGGMVDVPWLLPFNVWELGGYYVGIATLVLALVGAIGRSETAGRALRLALVATLLFAAATALGAAGPTHRFLFEHVPGFAFVRCPARALVAFVLVVPILGAFGAETVLGSEALLSKRGFPRPLGALLAIGVVVGTLVLSRESARPEGVTDLPALLLASAHAHAALVTGLLLALVVARHAASAPATVVLAGLVLIGSYDELAIARTYLKPRTLDHPVGMERFRAMEWLVAHAGRDRYATDAFGPFRLLNLGETLGLEAATGYGSVQLDRYARFVRLANGAPPEGLRPLGEDRNALAFERMDSPLVDLLGVRYVVGPRFPGPGFVPRFVPDPRTAVRATAEPGWDARLSVYENLEAFPRAFVLYDVERAETLEEEERRVASPRFDPRRLAIVGGDVGVRAENRGRPLGPARVIERTADRLVVEAEAAAHGILVLGEVFAKGFSAEVDGAPAPIVPVDLALRGIPLGPGRHRIVVTYRDRAVLSGAAISALGLVSLVLLARRTRRA